VQVDAWPSPSALRADEWLAIEPGAEGALALGLARAVAELAPGRLAVETLAALSPFTPERVQARTGIEPARLAALARWLVAAPPAVAIGGGDPGGGPLGRDAERAVAILNVALGSVGVSGGIVGRRALPGVEAQGSRATSLDDVPPGSVGLAVLDAADDGRALPWPLVERTLAPGALVVSHSAFESGLAHRAGLVIPAPAPLEDLDEVLPAADDTVASYALAPAVRAKPPGSLDTFAFVRQLGAATGRPVSGESLEALMKARVTAVHALGRGRFVARSERAWSETDAGDAAAAWQVLVDGGVWIDAPEPPAMEAPSVPMPSSDALRLWLEPAAAAGSLALVTFAARATAGSTPVSPLLTKLYQETALRLGTGAATLHPHAASELGLDAGAPVVIEGARGTVRASVRVDPALPTGRVVLATGPAAEALQPGSSATKRAREGALAAAGTETDGTWRRARVRVREA
jgi:anaerobic selenocysteine-containing dehydrogenase